MGLALKGLNSRLALIYFANSRRSTVEEYDKVSQVRISRLKVFYERSVFKIAPNLQENNCTGIF